MRCEHVFHESKADEYGACPKCGMGHYGAVFVYGRVKAIRRWLFT
jgi:DNA-directed RNA polymerase subunit RPC12/RpoP